MFAFTPRVASPRPATQPTAAAPSPGSVLGPWRGDDGRSRHCWADARHTSVPLLTAAFVLPAFHQRTAKRQSTQVNLTLLLCEFRKKPIF